MYPPATSCNLEAETVSRLAKIKHIVAIKEAAGMHGSGIRNKGPCTRELSLSIPVMILLPCPCWPWEPTEWSVLLPIWWDEKLQDMVKAFFAGQWQQALSIHQEQLFPLFQRSFLTTNPVPGENCSENCLVTRWEK
jgi:dihydrodipicolinate synthase/N-acetylneuraminate lyase